MASRRKAIAAVSDQGAAWASSLSLLLPLLLPELAPLLVDSLLGGLLPVDAEEEGREVEDAPPRGPEPAPAPAAGAAPAPAPAPAPPRLLLLECDERCAPEEEGGRCASAPLPPPSDAPASRAGEAAAAAEGVPGTSAGVSRVTDALGLADSPLGARIRGARAELCELPGLQPSESPCPGSPS